MDPTHNLSLIMIIFLIYLTITDGVSSLSAL